MFLVLLSIRSSGANEQLGGARQTCKTWPTRGVWGMLPQENLHALKLNLEPSGGITKTQQKHKNKTK